MPIRRNAKKIRKMNIENFVKTRDFALIQSEVTVLDNNYIKVDVLSIQAFWENTIEELFEHDILPDIDRPILINGVYYCNVLVTGYAGEELNVKVIDFDFSFIESIASHEKESFDLPFM